MCVNPTQNRTKPLPRTEISLLYIPFFIQWNILISPFVKTSLYFQRSNQETGNKSGTNQETNQMVDMRTDVLPGGKKNAFNKLYTSVVLIRSDRGGQAYRLELFLHPHKIMKFMKHCLSWLANRMI